MTALPPINVGAASPSVQPQSFAGGSPAKQATETSEPKQNSAFELLLERTDQDQKLSEQAIQDLVAGKSDNVHDVVMQVVKAEMSFQIFMEVRNQLIESYNELSRMQF